MSIGKQSKALRRSGEEGLIELNFIDIEGNWPIQDPSGRRLTTLWVASQLQSAHHRWLRSLRMALPDADRPQDPQSMEELLGSSAANPEGEETRMW
jgi:hypothetical protein